MESTPKVQLVDARFDWRRLLRGRSLFGGAGKDRGIHPKNDSYDGQGTKDRPRWTLTGNRLWGIQRVKSGGVVIGRSRQSADVRTGSAYFSLVGEAEG